MGPVSLSLLFSIPKHIIHVTGYISTWALTEYLEMGEFRDGSKRERGRSPLSLMSFQWSPALSEGGLCESDGPGSEPRFLYFLGVGV